MYFNTVSFWGEYKANFFFFFRSSHLDLMSKNIQRVWKEAAQSNKYRRRRQKGDIQTRCERGKRGKCEVEESCMKSWCFSLAATPIAPILFSHTHFMLVLKLKLLEGQNSKSQRKINITAVKNHIFFLSHQQPQKLTPHWVKEFPSGEGMIITTEL